MAEIPVKRKGGAAWWIWVLPLGVLALLLMFGMRGCDRSAAVGDGDADDRARITAEGVGNRAFTVTAGTGEMFVMLADSLNSGTAEAAAQARPGEVMHLGGRFQRVGDQETRDEKSRGLQASEAQQMAGQQIYLHATSARSAQ